jgi:hypothetical protein
LLGEKFKSGASNEVECLSKIIEDQTQEIVSLKAMVEANPLLAQQFARVKDLELQM